MLYCEKCKIPTEGPCPVCGRITKKLREIEGHDAVLLISCRFQQASMLEPFLNDSGIPCYRDGALGAALATAFGSFVELYHLYVPYARYKDAHELVSTVFAEDVDIMSRLQYYNIPEP